MTTAQPVTKTVGGVTFEDRFAHLHEDTPEAVAWQWGRSAKAQAAAEASPNYAPVRERLIELGKAGAAYAAPRKIGGRWWAYGTLNGEQVLEVRDTPAGAGRAIVTGPQLALDGGNAMLTWFEPSPHGRFVAVCNATNGDMVGRWSVLDAATGAIVLHTPAIAYTGARPGWLPDESGFWLDGRTAEGLHSLRFVPVADGTPGRPEVVLPETLVEPKHSGLTPQISPDGRKAVVVTEPHEHMALVLLDLETLEARAFLPGDFDGECDGSWRDAQTYLARVNGSDSPRGRVVAIPAATPQDRSTWREVVPESEGFMGWAGVVGKRLYVGDLVDVSLRVRVFDLDGALVETLPLETPGSSPSMLLERAVRPTEALALTHSSFTRGGALLVHDPETGALSEPAPSALELKGASAALRFAVSRDGVRIPYFVVRRDDLPAAPQPTLVHGYGGFNMSLLPSFPTTFAPFIEAGGVFVQASLRGGAEYGRAWHDGGRLANKQNTFDDLRAVAEALIADGVSTPEQMAFMGGSNGGLLAGVAIVQQPDLWRAVVPTVPIFDMMEPLPDTAAIAGIRAIFFEDYGDPSKPEDAARTIHWSPYHNVRDGVAYPAVYQVFGEKDLGCMPFHGRKFTARLDEADIGGRPIHLRIWKDAGHGVADPELSASWNAEWLAFVMDHIGLEARKA